MLAAISILAGLAFAHFRFSPEGPLDIKLVMSTGVGIGTVVNGMLHAQGRNPEARGELFTNMILGIVFCESIAIYSMVIAFIILFVL